MELREYQKAAVDKIRSSMAHGNKHVILQAPCGAGKTIISAEIAKCAAAKDKKVLFLVNRRDLVKQTVDKYKDFGVDSGVIMAGIPPSLGESIQCASLQTYGRRLKLDEILHNPWFHSADLVIFDEVQSANAPTYQAILDLYQDKHSIGLSATPHGAGGRGLGYERWDKIIPCISTQELVEKGYLVPAVHYRGEAPDLEGVGTVAGDWNKKQLAERSDKKKLIGDLVENWFKLSSDRSTIVFAVNVKHSLHIKQEFESHGVAIEHIDAHTKDDERERIYSGFESGDIQIITNVGVACEGSDLPICSSVAICRATKRVERYIQMGGRGARPYPEKDDYLLLDFAGLIKAHGLINVEQDWSLDAKGPAAKPSKKRKKKDKVIIECEVCRVVFTGRTCPRCGWRVTNYPQRVEAHEAELKRVEGDPKPKKKKYTMDEKRRWYGMFEHWRRTHPRKDGSLYAPGWTGHKYREKFGCWPKGVKMDGVPIEALPNREFSNWMRHLAIKYSKSKDKQKQCEKTA